MARRRWVLGVAAVAALLAGCKEAKEKLGIEESKPKQTVDPNVEADRHVQQIAQAAERIAAGENGVFPASAPPTPGRPACEGDKPVALPVDEADWAQPTWAKLGFKPRRPSRFQYSFESNGRAFTARAVGDLNCDGKAVTFERTGYSQPMLDRCREAINKTLAYHYFALSKKSLRAMVRRQSKVIDDRAKACAVEGGAWIECVMNAKTRKEFGACAEAEPLKSWDWLAVGKGDDK